MTEDWMTIYWIVLGSIGGCLILGYVYYALSAQSSRKHKRNIIEDIDKHTIGNILYMQSRSQLKKENGLAIDA